ncbi:MAG: hypothetical protein ACOCWY_02035 [Thermodesulfobacteriota bacterium]
MWKYFLCLVACLSAGLGFAQENPVDTQVCESAFNAAGQWRYPDRAALESALTEASEEKAVQTLFSEELEGYEAAVFPEAKIITALRDLVICDGAYLSVEEPLSFCMRLQGCRIEPADRERFDPVEIGRVCNINPNLVQTQAEKIKEIFARQMVDTDQGPSLTSIGVMMADPGQIRRYEEAALKALVHEVDVAPSGQALSGSACLSLVVYPVELYAATAFKNESE